MSGTNLRWSASSGTSSAGRLSWSRAWGRARTATRSRRCCRLRDPPAGRRAGLADRDVQTSSESWKLEMTQMTHPSLGKLEMTQNDSSKSRETWNDSNDSSKSRETRNDSKWLIQVLGNLKWLIKLAYVTLFMKNDFIWMVLLSLLLAWETRK